jgi:hypothetical protein
MFSQLRAKREDLTRDGLVFYRSGHFLRVRLEIIGTVAWLLLPAALGRAARLRLAYLEAANARAEYAERTREEEARHRVADERMRIARAAGQACGSSSLEGQ